jgi:hypothetical protein
MKWGDAVDCNKKAKKCLKKVENFIVAQGAQSPFESLYEKLLSLIQYSGYLLPDSVSITRRLIA